MNLYKQFLENHGNEFELEPSKAWWIKYVYHFSNIDNIISILQHGYLYSRNECIRRGLMKNENASTEVINQTKDAICDCVRLYFRPKTPTQFYNEGFSISRERIKFNTAHIPVPVFLAFRSYEILNLSNSFFSDSSLATHDFSLYNDFEKFKTLDFKSIYHDSRLKEEEKAYILQKRQSEIAITKELSLDYLDMIWCRSNAEYVTLVNLLTEKNLINMYRDKISVKQASNLFYMHHTYIDNVNLDMDILTIHLKNVTNQDLIEMVASVQIGSITYRKSATIKPHVNYQYDLGDLRTYIEQEGKYSCKVYFVDKSEQVSKEVLVYYGKWSFDFDLPF